jgi:hypothetical protein
VHDNEFRLALNWQQINADEQGWKGGISWQLAARTETRDETDQPLNGGMPESDQRRFIADSSRSTLWLERNWFQQTGWHQQAGYGWNTGKTGCVIIRPRLWSKAAG